MTLFRFAYCTLLVFLLAGEGSAAQTRRKMMPPRRAPSIYEQVEARAALVYDVRARQFLFQRNINSAYPPASTTKLMTALLVYERTHLEGAVQVQPEDTFVEPSHVPLRAGEVVSIRNLTYALLIGSDNDTAMTLARYAGGGNRNQFIELMNLRARQLGCQRTTFKNPSGLPAQGQFTTALDLLRIFQAAISIPELRRICTTQRFALTTAAKRQIVENHNKLLGRYDGMGPAKTGWTYSSRHTYAASVTRNGRELQLIILNSPNKWRDAQLLLDYSFARLPQILEQTTGNTPAQTQVTPG